MQVLSVSKLGSRGNQDFFGLPWKLYSDSHNWVPPLRREIKQKLDPKHSSFFNYGKVKSFVAYDGKNAVGRIVGITNPLHKKFHGEDAGFFGFFECIDSVQVAQQLLDQVRTFLISKGCTKIIGPVNLNTNDESGFLVEGFSHRPTFMCNYCHSYYDDLMMSCGMNKAVDTLAYEALHGHAFPNKYDSVRKRVERNPRIHIRHLNRSNVESDIRDIQAVYNQAFLDTWGFVPITDGEAHELAKSILSFADEQLIWIATYDDLPVGIILGFPDLNEILHKLNGRLTPLAILRILWGRRSITGMRVAAFGVLPDYRTLGIETILIHKVHRRIHTRPYKRAEFSVVMESNVRMRNLLESAGFRLSRRFRIYTDTLLK